MSADRVVAEFWVRNYVRDHAAEVDGLNPAACLAALLEELDELRSGRDEFVARINTLVARINTLDAQLRWTRGLLEVHRRTVADLSEENDTLRAS